MVSVKCLTSFLHLIPHIFVIFIKSLDIYQPNPPFITDSIMMSEDESGQWDLLFGDDSLNKKFDTNMMTIDLACSEDLICQLNHGREITD